VIRRVVRVLASLFEQLVKRLETPGSGHGGESTAPDDEQPE
jgi:hypothetical protein